MQALAVVEMGGYPELLDWLREAGLALHCVPSVRKAQAWLRGAQPGLVLAEFHFDPGLRDRVGNLESLIAALQREHAQAPLLVLVHPEHRERLERMRVRHPHFVALTRPLTQERFVADVLPLIDRLETRC